jgi:hypothetical protein
MQLIRTVESLYSVAVRNGSVKEKGSYAWKGSANSWEKWVLKLKQRRYGKNPLDVLCRA